MSEEGCSGCGFVMVLAAFAVVVAGSAMWKEANAPPDTYTTPDPRLTARTLGSGEPRPVPLSPETQLIVTLSGFGFDAADINNVRITNEPSWFESKNSRTVYVKKHDLEQIPFPDRPDAYKKIAASWCTAVRQKSYLTTVTIADITTGQTFDKERCSAVGK